jgi:hypothetical protein
MRVVMYPPGVARLEHRIARVTERVTKAVARDARRFAPVEDGALVASIREQHSRFTGRVWVGTDHWQPQEYGALPHIIRSRGGIYAYPLRNPAKGFYAYPGIVNHPGNPEIAYMRRAVYRRRALSTVL